MGPSERGVAGMSAFPGRLRVAPWRRPRAARGYGAAVRVVNLGALARLLLAVAVLVVAAMHGTAAAAVPRILAFGDSLTAGLGLPADQAFPARLQAKLAALGVPAEVINAGVSGETTAGGLARVDWVLGEHPDYAILELGANDMLRGLDPKQAFANLDKILTRLEAAHVKVLLTGMLALANWGRDYADEFAAIYPALAKRHGVPLYPFFLDGVALDRTLNQEDGLHPNARGVDVIVERLAPHVVRLVKGEDVPK
jgi:acyl-CoA thioesterase-1